MRLTSDGEPGRPVVQLDAGRYGYNHRQECEQENKGRSAPHLPLLDELNTFIDMSGERVHQITPAAHMLRVLEEEANAQSSVRSDMPGSYSLRIH